MPFELRKMIGTSPSTIPIHDESNMFHNNKLESLEKRVFLAPCIQKSTKRIPIWDRKAMEKFEICFFDKDE
jgi:hypothetical protein